MVNSYLLKKLDNTFCKNMHRLATASWNFQGTTNSMHLLYEDDLPTVVFYKQELWEAELNDNPVCVKLSKVPVLQYYFNNNESV